MKYFLYATAIVLLLWGIVVNKGYSSNYMFLAASYTSAFFGAALIYLYDFSMTQLGKNSSYMVEFYSELKTDLIVAIVFGLTLLLLFSSTPTAYSWSSIDLAGLGIPFLVYALINTFQLGSMRIGKNKLPQKIIVFMLLIQGVTYAISVYCLLYILNGKASTAQSIWIQLSIVSAALTFFFGAKQIGFIFRKQHMEVSPVLLNLFQSLPNSMKLYEQADNVAGLWNTEVRKNKAENRKLAKSKIGKRKRR